VGVVVGAVYIPEAEGRLGRWEMGRALVVRGSAGFAERLPAWLSVESLALRRGNYFQN
jgi:hypothetical protein